MTRTKHTEGFTVAELMLVVAIIAVLAGIVSVALYSYARDLALTENDNAAKSLYIAAQNNIADLQASGEWIAGKAAFTEQAGHPVAERTDAGPDAGDDGDYYYVNAEAARSNGILPAGTVEADVWSHDYIIEYNYETAMVYGVFYTEDDGALATYYPGDGGADIRDRETRRSKLSGTSVIGYYGGADARNLPSIQLEEPVITAGRGPNVGIADGNFGKSVDAVPSLKTTLIVTVSKADDEQGGHDKDDAGGGSGSADGAMTPGDSVTLVITRDSAVAAYPTVSYLTRGGTGASSLETLTMAQNDFCSLAGNAAAETKYSINLAALKSNVVVGSFVEGIAGDDGFDVEAKCVTTQALCRPVYGYGNGVWPASDDVIFTSNIIADYEDSTDIYVYNNEGGSGGKGSQADPFWVALENYYNDSVVADENLYYTVSLSDGLAYTGDLVVAERDGHDAEALSPQAGYYLYSHNVAEDGPSSFVYHKVQNLYVRDATTSTEETIVVNVYRQAKSVDGSPIPAAQPSKTLTFNVHVLNGARGYDWHVEDKGSYAEVVVVAGSDGVPSLRISTPANVAADQSNRLIQGQGKTIVLEPLSAGASASVKFFKADPSAALSDGSFTVDPTVR